MLIKKILTTSSMVLALSTFFVATSWASTQDEAEPKEMEIVSEETKEMVECISQTDLDSMSDEDKDKLELPVCDDESEDKDEPSDK